MLNTLKNRNIARLTPIVILICAKLLVIFVLVQSGCIPASNNYEEISGPGNSTLLATDGREKAAAEVYVALLKHRERKLSNSRDVILGVTVAGNQITEKRISDVLAKYYGTDNEVVKSDLIEDLLSESKNASSLSIPTEFNDRYTVISDTELNSIFSTQTGWAEFHRQYPSAALILFSRVGLNLDRTKAIVFVSESSGLRTAEGNFFFVEKRGDTWIVTQTINAWVS